MNRAIAILCVSAVLTACAAHPPKPVAAVATSIVADKQQPVLPVGPDAVHQVMILVTINRLTGVMTHAQVVGGFADNDACTHAAPGAATIASRDPQFDPDDVPIVLCPRVALGNELPPSSLPGPRVEPANPPYDEGMPTVAPLPL